MDLDEFFEELYGSDDGELVSESGDDMDFDDKDLEIPEFDEGSDSDVDTLLDSIETGGADDDIEDVDDDELAELEKEYHITAAGGDGLEEDPIDDEFPELDEACATDEACGAPASVDECGEPLAPLDPELDLRGDQMLASIVTPGLAEDMLSDDEYSDFIESGDAQIAASEGYLDDQYVLEAAECDEIGFDEVFGEAAFAPEGKKYKMTKSARLRQLYQVSLQIEARLHKDPGYAKMQKIYKIRRGIRQSWHQRYGALAMRRAKRYLKGIMKSKSNGIAKIATRLVGKK